MAYTPPEIEQILEQMRDVLMRWHKEDLLGEVAVVRGGQGLQVEERPIHRHPTVKRESKRAGYVERVGQA